MGRDRKSTLSDSSPPSLSETTTTSIPSSGMARPRGHQAKSLVSTGDLNRIERQRSTNRLRQRLRLKRNFMFCIWTLLFIFYNLNSEDAGRGAIPPGFCAQAFSVGTAEDSGRLEYSTVFPSSAGQAVNWAGPQGAPNSGNTSSKGTSSKKQHEQRTHNKYRDLEVPGVNCTPPGIDDFPPDLFTQHQRQQGYVIIHFLVSMYIFYALALVCDDYFVPSMECICEELNMPSDVAGATFMAIATSAPELFTNIIGTFITHGDIGIGTIVGSAVFNILAVCAVCGLGAGMIVPLEWYSVTRDCFFYSISVVLLLSCLWDERIYWYEALLLVAVYILYIIGMYNNSKFKRKSEKMVYKIRNHWRRFRGYPKPASATITKHLQGDEAEQEKFQLEQTELSGDAGGGGDGKVIAAEMDEEEEDREIDEAVETYNEELEMKEHEVVEEALKHAEEYAEEEKDEFSLWKLPWGHGVRVWVEWFVCWPIRATYTITIPDCRETKWRHWFPLTFIMCIIWIGVLSYIVNWMMTIIGHTLTIPDSIMGLTFIAAGTSIPEVVSSLIVSRQGLGTMALSNSIGSNTFDILICLGLPWLIQASLIAKDPVEPYIQINSLGLQYSAMMLITSLVLLYIILAANNYVLDKKVGFISLLLYGLFLIMASLFELNVFFVVNLPTCQYHED